MLKNISRQQKMFVAILTAVALVTSFSWNSHGKLDIPMASAAQSDYFLQIEGIEGESTDSMHRGEIEINSWSWGASNPGITNGSGHGGGGGAGKATFSDISFTKRIDKASPQLALACASGKHFPTAKLTVRKAGTGQEYYVITLKEVMVSSYQVGGDGNAETETISLNFTKIEWTYTAPSADGTSGEVMKAGWDLAKQKKI